MPVKYAIGKNIQTVTVLFSSLFDNLQEAIIVWQRNWPDVRFAKCQSVFRVPLVRHITLTGRYNLFFCSLVFAIVIPLCQTSCPLRTVHLQEAVVIMRMDLQIYHTKYCINYFLGFCILILLCSNILKFENINPCWKPPLFTFNCNITCPFTYIQ